MGFIRSAGHALGRHGVARVRVQSPGGGSLRVAVSLSAAAVHSGADCGVRMGCSALHVAGTLGMGAASGCNMRAAYCIHSLNQGIKDNISSRGSDSLDLSIDAGLTSENSPF